MKRPAGRIRAPAEPEALLGQLVKGGVGAASSAAAERRGLRNTQVDRSEVAPHDPCGDLVALVDIAVGETAKGAAVDLNGHTMPVPVLALTITIAVMAPFRVYRPLRGLLRRHGCSFPEVATSVC